MEIVENARKASRVGLKLGPALTNLYSSSATAIVLISLSEKLGCVPGISKMFKKKASFLPDTFTVKSQVPVLSYYCTVCVGLAHHFNKCISSVSVSRYSCLHHALLLRVYRYPIQWSTRFPRTTLSLQAKPYTVYSPEHTQCK